MAVQRKPLFQCQPDQLRVEIRVDLPVLLQPAIELADSVRRDHAVE